MPNAIDPNSKPIGLPTILVAGCSKVVSAVKALAAPTLLALGVVLAYQRQLTALLAYAVTLAPQLNRVFANPMIIGHSLIAIAGIICVKKLYDSSVELAAKKEFQTEKEKTSRLMLEAADAQDKLQTVEGKVSRLELELAELKTSKEKDGDRVVTISSYSATGANSVKKISLQGTNLEIVTKLSKKEKNSLYETYSIPAQVITALNSCSVEVCKILKHHTDETDDGDAIQTLVLPYCSESDLLSLLETPSLLPLGKRIIFGGGLVAAVYSMHSKGLIHGDLKSSNVLLDSFEGEYGARLIDFDLTHFHADQPDLNELPGYQQKRVDFGSQPSWAPEVYMAEDLREIDRRKTDVWALGVILYELFVKQSNGDFLDQTYETIKESREELQKKGEAINPTSLRKLFLEKVENFNDWIKWDEAGMIDERLEQLKELLKKMLEVTPENRCDMKHVFDEFDRIMQESNIAENDPSIVEVVDESEEVEEPEEAEESNGSIESQSASENSDDSDSD